ncbi:MBL fold metallo-hydrolase [Microbulbifer spongiae]|uniref:MBL fold metallo-hydrolase n=1 Tax=Microbulbifer spongiae TaxID=2944933 RepID=A0ABY9EBW2_9GAMM|nr:MBL fold metallo-hydrolase [Microbulbifer sp. MI-G]WKD50142.1 MBL fold metallo-hydrolase [Microbulbifer sp. MI-G]
MVIARMRNLIILFFGTLLAACAASKVDIRERSPNFKDGVFSNTNPVETKSFWEIVWSGLTTETPTERAEWPDWVEAQTDDAPLERVLGSDARITFINHATFLIQVGGFNILTDPVFSERTSPVSFIGPKRVHSPGIAIDSLPRVDVILISHDHYDHLDLNTISKLIERDNPNLYMGLGVGRRLSVSEKISELDWWENIQVADNFQLWFLDVQHFSGRSLTDRNSTLWGGFLLEVGGKKIYFGGDSGYADHYLRTYERFGPVDVALLPIGAYAPRNLFKPVHLDPFEAVQAHIDLKANLSIGMHYGTFQLSAEAHNEPVELLEQAKREAGLPPDTFITLEVGQPFQLPNLVASGI